MHGALLFHLALQASKLNAIDYNSNITILFRYLRNNMIIAFHYLYLINKYTNQIISTAACELKKSYSTDLSKVRHMRSVVEWPRIGKMQVKKAT